MPAIPPQRKLATFAPVSTLNAVRKVSTQPTKGIAMKKVIALLLLLWGFPAFLQGTKALLNLDKNGVGPGL